MKSRKSRISCILVSLFLIIFVLDYFVFVKEGTNIFTIEHLIKGNHSGYMTQYGRLLHVNAMNPEWWRLLTYVFLHAGFPQLVINSIGLYCIGTVVERAVGGGKVLLTFCFSGIVAGLFSTFITYRTVGAGGAIYGLVGVLLVLIIRNRKESWSSVALLKRGIILLYLVISNMNGVNGLVANEIGLISGIILGLILVDTTQTKQITNISANRKAENRIEIK